MLFLPSSRLSLFFPSRFLVHEKRAPYYNIIKGRKYSLFHLPETIL